jgi:hypothetical protein
MSAHTKSKKVYETDSMKCIHASISIYLSDGECWYSWHRVDYWETMKIEQLLRSSVNSNHVQSTVTNNKHIQQTVIYLVPMMPNPRITLFPYSNIQENLTINFDGTNDKNWNSDLYWKMMFNSCNKYGELYCRLFVDVIYFVIILMNKHKFLIYF